MKPQDKTDVVYRKDIIKYPQYPQYPQCEKLFSHDSMLKLHIQSHSDNRPFECKKCEKKYKRKDHHIYHEKSSHQGLRRYYCSMCDSTFDNSVHKLVDSEAKPQKCSVCSQTFSLQGNMRRHIETLHSEDRPFGCHNCNDTFKLKENLKSHVRRIHLKHKKFNCKDCQAIFGTNAELSCHIKLD